MVTNGAKSTGAAAGHPAGPEAPPPPPGDGSQPALETGAAPGGDRTTTIRLPLLSATFTRPARAKNQQLSPSPQAPSSTGGVPIAGIPVADRAVSVGGVSLPRLAFYAGAVALGALEVVEWPVTLLVVAGTYFADQVRGSTAAGAAAPGAAARTAGSSAAAGPAPAGRRPAGA